MLSTEHFDPQILLKRVSDSTSSVDTMPKFNNPLLKRCSDMTSLPEAICYQTSFTPDSCSRFQNSSSRAGLTCNWLFSFLISAISNSDCLCFSCAIDSRSSISTSSLRFKAFSFQKIASSFNADDCLTCPTISYRQVFTNANYSMYNSYKCC